jgi:hypothetical protein
MPISKTERLKRKKSGKWFEAGKSLGWHASDGQAHRREAALKSRRGNALATARALLALANVNHRQNPEMARKAYADAQYFFRMNRDKKAGK